MKQVKVGIIGFGFMGTTHFRIHQANPKSKIVAIADADAAKRKGDIRKVHGNIGGGVNDYLDLTGIKVYKDGMDLINDPEVEEVDICAPTYLHADFAVAALKAGKHVLLEKPAALTVKDVKRVMAAVEKADTCFTVGLCVRAWPEYRKAFELFKAGKIGKIRSALFKRFSPNIDGDAWKNWFMEDKNSGGALLDLHMHDIDQVLYFCGKPTAVTTIGTWYKTGIPDHSFTLYHFDDDQAVCAEGGWSAPRSVVFDMSFQLIGTKGTIVSNNTGLWFYPIKGEPEKIELNVGDLPTGWHVEIDNFLSAVLGKSSDEKYLPHADIVAGACIHEAERKSLEAKGKTVKVNYR